MIININEYFLKIRLIQFGLVPKYQYTYWFIYGSTKNQTELFRNRTKLLIWI